MPAIQHQLHIHCLDLQKLATKMFNCLVAYADIAIQLFDCRPVSGEFVHHVGQLFILYGKLFPHSLVSNQRI